MAANYVLLETLELSQSASSITIDNIPQTGYTDLKIVTSLRTSASGANWALIGINGGADSVSTLTHLLAFGGSLYGQSYSSFRTVIANPSFTTYAYSTSEIHITNYTSNSHKAISGTGVLGSNSTSLYALQLANYTYPSTSAISSLTFTVDGGGNFVAGTTISLYGLAATGTTPAVGPKAEGGNIIANDGTYWYHAFLGSGTFTPKLSLTCDVLQIAGSGGGVPSSASSGGSGAGGVSYVAAQSLSAQVYPVTVGAGGSGGTMNSSYYITVQPRQGINSQFGSLTAAVGGGYGGSGSGGSGGGGTTNGGSGGAGTAGQGNAGGAAGTGGNYYSGGGGGAGAVGGSGVSGLAVGGVGTSAYSAWGLATGTGHNVGGTVYYAGGGGGSSNGAGGGAGGYGGGGQGATANKTAATAGTANTGGGTGGGSNIEGFAATAPNGASGIVIVRYAMA